MNRKRTGLVSALQSTQKCMLLREPLKEEISATSTCLFRISGCSLSGLSPVSLDFSHTTAVLGESRWQLGPRVWGEDVFRDSRFVRLRLRLDFCDWALADGLSAFRSCCGWLCVCVVQLLTTTPRATAAVSSEGKPCHGIRHVLDFVDASTASQQAAINV